MATKKENDKSVSSGDLSLEYIKQSHEQNLAYRTQNKMDIEEFVNKTIGKNKKEIKEFIKKISEIGEQNKRQYDDLVAQNKKQISEMFTTNKKQNSEYLKSFFDKSNQYVTRFIERFSYQASRENEKLLEKIHEQTHKQISKFIKNISEKNHQQNSIFIKQNTKLIDELLHQSLANHGTVSQRMESLLMYQILSTLRENLVTIKISMTIFEKLDGSQLKIVKNLYLEYQKLYPTIPFLDVTRGMILAKILFPSFFSEIIKKMSRIKNQFDDETECAEMLQTVHLCASFFKNFNAKSIGENQQMLKLHIQTLDEMLEKIID